MQVFRLVINNISKSWQVYTYNVINLLETCYQQKLWFMQPSFIGNPQIGINLLWTESTDAYNVMRNI